MGDYYVRQLRGSAPLINDPLLVQYINGLGMRGRARQLGKTPSTSI